MAVGNHRSQAIDARRKPEKEAGISEGGLARAEKAMDVTTRKYVEAIDELLKNKEAELSEV